jgi:hypothetical protein
MSLRRIKEGGTTGVWGFGCPGRSGLRTEEGSREERIGAERDAGEAFNQPSTNGGMTSNIVEASV